jgi:hypothetical protein
LAFLIFATWLFGSIGINSDFWWSIIYYSGQHQKADRFIS